MLDSKVWTRLILCFPFLQIVKQKSPYIEVRNKYPKFAISHTDVSHGDTHYRGQWIQTYRAKGRRHVGEVVQKQDSHKTEEPI